MKIKKLSVIIPVYNEIKFLQTFTQNLTESFHSKNVEYIFVNDGSHDGSENWLNKYVSEKLLLNENNKEKFLLVNFLLKMRFYWI